MSIQFAQQSFSLPASGRLLLPFDIESAVESLPVFCSSEAQASVLSYLTKFLEGGYHLEIRACPSTQQQSPSNVIQANQQYEDQISVPAGSFLMMIGGITTGTLGFRVSVYGSGSQTDVTDGFVNGNLISGNFIPTQYLVATTVSGNQNLFILPAPLTIDDSSQLNIQIVNLDQSAETIEMAFYFAVPNGTSNIETNAAVVKNAVTR